MCTPTACVRSSCPPPLSCSLPPHPTPTLVPATSLPPLTPTTTCPGPRWSTAGPRPLMPRPMATTRPAPPTRTHLHETDIPLLLLLLRRISMNGGGPPATPKATGLPTLSPHLPTLHLPTPTHRRWGDGVGGLSWVAARMVCLSLPGPLLVVCFLWSVGVLLLFSTRKA